MKLQFDTLARTGSPANIIPSCGKDGLPGVVHMSMLKGAFFAAPILCACACAAFAQTAQQLNYCKALTTSYRSAVSSGAAPVQKLEAAIVECSTNPVGSIPVLERGLKEMKVELPPRP